jgi:hypothetical protein
MFRLTTLVMVGLSLTLSLLTGTVAAQSSQGNVAAISYNNIEVVYEPEAFGAVLPHNDTGTPFQADAPYFANVAPHTTFTFLRPNPTRPDTNYVGELQVYRIADLYEYAEPSYREVVEELQTLDTGNLGAYMTVGADYHIPALPFMPVLNATQVFRAHPAAINFESVTGIEYYTYYSQAAEPILEGQVMYTYQGITTDGLHYLSFSMPIETGLLETAIANDLNWDVFHANYAQYLQDTFANINNADTRTFKPQPIVLNRFIQSVSIGR